MTDLEANTDYLSKKKIPHQVRPIPGGGKVVEIPDYKVSMTYTEEGKYVESGRLAA